MFPHSAAHADDWCFWDPTVSIAGHQVHINVGYHGSKEKAIKDVAMANIGVFVPAGVPASLISAESGGFPETLNVVPSGEKWTPGHPFKVYVGVLFTSNADEAVDTATRVTHPGDDDSETDIATNKVIKGKYSYTLQKFHLK